VTKTAIVTGASSGIGKAIAQKLTSEGVNVALVARRQEKLAVIEREINENSSNSGKALAIPTDVSNRNEVESMVHEARNKFGPIDIYINNAGVMLNALVTEGQVEKWDQMIDVNVKGVLYGIHAVIPSMLQRKKGHIINISSVSGLEVTKRSTVYSATKFAVRAISMGLEKELARTGVRVTNISPGMVDTDLVRRQVVDRKMLEAYDIADAVYYAIRQPDYVNVNEITIRPV